MATVSTLEDNVQQRLEETTDGVGAFWNVALEIRPAIVEAMNFATLVTGEPQVRAIAPITIPASTVFTPIAMPADAVALLRVEGIGSLPLQKAYIWDLDRHYPGWEVQTGPEPRMWIPFGLTQFGIYPCLTAPAQVVLNYVQTPVNTPRPYTGEEPVVFKTEFQQGIEDYAAAVLRIKERDPEVTQALSQFNRALSTLEELSRFAYRKNSLRFTRAGGASSAITDVRSR